MAAKKTETEGIVQYEFEERTVSISEVKPNGTNRDVIEDANLKELTSSIREVGIINPITVTPDGKKFKIVAGERRFRAAQIAGLKDIPVRIYKDAPEDVLRSAQVAENLQRTDLTPLEEGRAVSHLITEGHDIKVIARRLGKTVPWVRKRASLANLSDAWIKKIAKPSGSTIGQWPAEYLELVSRLPVEEQDIILSFYINSYALPRMDDIRRTIIDRTNLISAAPWKADDAELVPEAGSCSACPFTTASNPDLFGDMAKPTKSDPQAVCLKESCWRKKCDAVLSASVAQLRAEHKTVWLIADMTPESELKDAEKRLGCKSVSVYSVTSCKESDPNAVPAIFVSGRKAGRLQWIVDPLFEKKEAKAKASKVKKGAPADGGDEDTEDVKTSRTESRRRAAFVDQVHSELYAFSDYNFQHDAEQRANRADPGRKSKIELPDLPSTINHLFPHNGISEELAVRAVVMASFLLGQDGHRNDFVRKDSPEQGIVDRVTVKTLKKTDIRDMARNLAAIMFGVAADRMNRAGRAIGPDVYAEAEEWAEVLGLPVAAIRKKIADDIPYPKSAGDVDDAWLKD